MKKWWFIKWRLPVQLIVILAQVLVRTHGYSLGAGQQACSTMVPWHGGTPQSTPAPFEVKISQNTYQPLQQVRIDIRACGDFKFKGFLIQARLVQYYNQDIKIGVFGLYNNAPYKYTCAGQGSNGQALTHIDNSTKTNIAMVWQAPRVAQGHVMFRVTVVEDFSTYWVGAHSPIVWDTSSRVRFTQQQIQSVTTSLSPKCRATNTTTTPTPTTTTTTPKPTTTTTTPRPTTTTTTPKPTTTTTTPKPTTTTPEPTTTTTTTTPRPTTTTTTTQRPTTMTTTTQAPPQMTTTTASKEEIKTTTVLPQTTTLPPKISTMPPTTSTMLPSMSTLPPRATTATKTTTTTLPQKTTTDWLMGFLGDEDVVSTKRSTGNVKTTTVSSVTGMKSTTMDSKIVKPSSTASPVVTSKDTTLLPGATSTVGIQTSSLPPHLVRTTTTLHSSTGMVNNTVSNTESTTNVASTEPDVIFSTTVASTTTEASTKAPDVVSSTTVALNGKGLTTTEDKFKSTSAEVVPTTVPLSPTTLSTAETKAKSTPVTTSKADAITASTTAETTTDFISTKDVSTIMNDTVKTSPLVIDGKITTLPTVSTSQKFLTTGAALTTGQRSTTEKVQPTSAKSSTTSKLTTTTQKDKTTTTTTNPINNLVSSLSPNVTITTTTKNVNPTTLEFFSIKTTMATDVENPATGSQPPMTADDKAASVSEMPVTETAFNTNSTLPVLTTTPAGDLKTLSNVSIATTGLEITTVPAGELETMSNASMATTGFTLTTVPAGDLETLSNVSMTTSNSTSAMATTTSQQSTKAHTLSIVTGSTNTELNKTLTTSPVNETASIHTNTLSHLMTDTTISSQTDKVTPTSHAAHVISSTNAPLTTMSKMKPTTKEPIETTSAPKSTQKTSTQSSHNISTVSTFSENSKDTQTSTAKSFPVNSSFTTSKQQTTQTSTAKSFPVNSSFTIDKQQTTPTLTTKSFPVNSSLTTNKQTGNLPYVTTSSITMPTPSTSTAKASPVVESSSYHVNTNPLSSSTQIPLSAYNMTSIKPQLTTGNKLSKILLSDIITTPSNIEKLNILTSTKSELQTLRISTLVTTTVPVGSTSTHKSESTYLPSTKSELLTVRSSVLMSSSTYIPKSSLSTSTGSDPQTVKPTVLLPTSTYTTGSTLTSFRKLDTQTVKSPVLLPTLIYSINSTNSNPQSVLSPSTLVLSSKNSDISSLAPSTNLQSQSSTQVPSSTKSAKSTLLSSSNLQTTSAPEVKLSSTVPISTHHDKSTKTLQSTTAVSSTNNKITTKATHANSNQEQSKTGHKTSPTPKSENTNQVKTIHKDGKPQTRPVSASFTQIVESTYQAEPNFDQNNQLSKADEFSHMPKTAYHTSTKPQQHTPQTSSAASAHIPTIQYIANPDNKKQIKTSTMTMAGNGPPSSGATVTMGTADKPLGTAFPYDPECNKSKGCFHDCRGQFCTYLISWVDRGSEMDFQLKAVVPPNLGDKWIAIGFSYDQHMGSDSVTECVTNRGQVSVYQSYNLDTHANARLRNPKFGLSNEGGSLVDGIFTCQFTRQKIVPAESRLFDLNKDWYILFAHGTAIADTFGSQEAMKLPHSYNPKPAVSNKLINLQEYLLNAPTTTTSTTTTTTTLPPKTTTTSTTTTTTPSITTTRPIWRPMTPSIKPPTMRPYTDVVTSTTTTTTTIKPPELLTIIEKDLTCGVIKGCYEKCRGDECSFIISWNDQGDTIDFEIRAQVPQDNGDHWVAIGFSGDENMVMMNLSFFVAMVMGLTNFSILGNDNVVECVTQDGMIDIYQSYNTGDKHNERLTQPQEGLSNTGGSLINGIFTCKFTRLKIIDGEDRAFNLNYNYYMMFANGKAYDGKKERHSIIKLPSVSNQLIDLQSHVEVTGHAKYYLIKLHGCLMILAWIFFASIGIVVARFYRQMWPDHFWCKERIWYQVHRACMITTLGCVIAGFILAFLDIRGYSQIDGKTFHQAHPIMGIIVTLLTITNPIVAMCRPLPGTTRRTVFDWLHRILGMSSHILAVITIFAGIELSKASAPDFMKYILMAYVGYQITVTLVLEIHKYFSNRKEDIRNQTYLYEMHRKPYYTRQNNASIDIDPPYSRTKKAILGSHILIIFATTLILIILLLIY